LLLKAVFWSENHPLALINDHTFGPGEKAKVRMGTTNVLVECTSIRPNAVKVRINGIDHEEELVLKPK